MARALGLAVALLLLAAPAAGALDGPTGELVAGSEETVLRLHDLPPGYQIGDDSGCGPLFPFGEGEEPEGRLERRYLKWVVRNWPEGCFYEYEQVFKVPGLGPAPPLVEVETLNTPSEEAASEGWRIYNELLPRSLSEGKGKGGSYLFWRQGTLLAFLRVDGLGFRRNERALRHFAAIQERRLAAPSPYTEAERDDTEVRLDDPGLRFPIYWVGRTFDPGGGLPPAALEDAFARDVGPPGEKVALWYEGFNLDLWTSASWKRFAKSKLGKVNLHARCTSKQPFPLERGSATIFATYDGRFRRCPKRKPDRFYAIARRGGMVIGVNLGLCLSCRGGARGPYGSKRAVVAILRALQVRPKPVY
ncbi:MAG TPA: hypothetical protein VGV34_03535 [Solirubrobacterales bacterium]|nr:hypothetical protein [Solirubrobacterales bacterium]